MPIHIKSTKKEPNIIVVESKEGIQEVKEHASDSSDDDSSNAMEAPPGIEELDNAANDMVQEFSGGSYTVSDEVTVNAHGDDEEHGETGF